MLVDNVQDTDEGSAARLRGITFMRADSMCFASDFPICFLDAGQLIEGSHTIQCVYVIDAEDLEYLRSKYGAQQLQPPYATAQIAKWSAALLERLAA